MIRGRTSGIAADLEHAADAIAARGGELGRPLHLLAETTSTNDEAKHAAKSGAPHGATWVTETQTAGRGRQGRAWVSPRGENLLFSVLLRLKCPLDRLPLIALAAGLAVRDAVARAAPGADAKIKWPNDVVSGDARRKIAGILVETTSSGGKVDALVVGIGINVHTREFPEELAERATSIALLGAPAPNRAEILADVLHGLDRDAALVAARGLGVVHSRLTKADALLGVRIESDADEGRVEGIARGIDPEGRLVVERDDGAIVRFRAGEVRVR